MSEPRYEVDLVGLADKLQDRMIFVDQVGIWDVWVTADEVRAYNKDAATSKDRRDFKISQGCLRFPRIAEQIMAVRAMLLGKIGDETNWE